MRDVSFGFQTWGFRPRQALTDLGHEVALAVTHPAGEQSCRAIFSQPVGQLARDHGVPVHLTERVDAASMDLLNRVPRTQSSSAVMSSSCAADI
jgi:methionyl-tRNA formyltransferase